jgi:hypothetical protein
MIIETSARGLSRLGADKLKAERMILQAEKKDIHSGYKEALNFLDYSLRREREALASIRFFIRGDAQLETQLKAKERVCDEIKRTMLKEAEEFYTLRCSRIGEKAQKPALSAEEVRLSKLIPARTEKMKGYFNAWEFREKVRDVKDLPKYMLGRAEFEVRNFIDGRRSILEIRNAVSAEHDSVTLQNVENYLLVLEKTGFVEIKKK